MASLKCKVCLNEQCHSSGRCTFFFLLFNFLFLFLVCLFVFNYLFKYILTIVVEFLLFFSAHTLLSHQKHSTIKSVSASVAIHTLDP